jgi:predicted kinase
MDARPNETKTETRGEQLRIHWQDRPGNPGKSAGAATAVLRRPSGGEAASCETRPESRQTQAFDDDFSPVVGEIDEGEGEGEPVAVVEPPAPGEGKLVHETQPESPSQPPPEPQAAGQKISRGFVVLAIGLPGSGKTTWFKRRGVTPLSSDMLRSILFDDITEQRYQGLVFSTLRSLLRARLIAKMPWNYVDATNLSPHERRQWIKMAKSFGYDVQAVFFDVPFEVCMERNHRRERTVSDETMKKMSERLRPPNFKEGFSKITVVRVKGSGPAADSLPAAE